MLLLITLLAAIVLAGCSGATPTPSAEDAMMDVYTAVAMTFASQVNTAAASPTSTPVSTSTLTTFPTATAFTYPTATLPSYSVVTSCYSSAYVSDVTIEDGTEIAPGESFVKTWELQNTGSCAWDDDFLLTFYSGEDMDGEATEIDEYVASGSAAEVSVTLTAPETDGTYTGYWILADSSGTAFGTTFYVQIEVSSDLVTSTPTPTSTDSTVSTSTPTMEPTSTFTPVPTETPTPTSTFTPTLTEMPNDTAAGDGGKNQLAG
jgi:hypothetical protein